MSNLALYACAVLIWGSTWLAITFQLGTVAPSVSVMTRFAGAALVLAVVARLRGMSLRFDARTHTWLALQGLFLFGINYVLVYFAELYLASGLVAVVFSLVTLCNIGLLRIFFGTPIKPLVLAGASLGIGGVVLLFWPDVTHASLGAQRRWGLAACALATVIASLGNMVATRNHRAGVPIVSGNAWAMLYGSLAVAAGCLVMGERLDFPLTFAYVASWLYLAVFGSVIAFVTYLTLLGRIGADRAGYAGVAIPVVAMLLSTWFEGMQWTTWMVVGMGLCLAGNALVLWPARAH